MYFTTSFKCTLICLGKGKIVSGCTLTNQHLLRSKDAVGNTNHVEKICTLCKYIFLTLKKNFIVYLSGMRLGVGKNSEKFYVAIDSNPILHRRF